MSEADVGNASVSAEKSVDSAPPPAHFAAPPPGLGTEPPHTNEIEAFMCRTLVLSAAALATLTLGAPARAQESTTRGFNIGAHFGGSSLEVQNRERREGGGGGLIVGYGVNRNWEIFLQVDAAEFDIENTDVDGVWTMGHIDLGTRFHFANSLRSWVPYLQAALSGRGVGVDDAVVLGVPQPSDGGFFGDGVGFFGGAFTLGGGIMFYFNETWAADLQLAFSGGEFTEIKVNNVTWSGLEVDAQSSRLNIGVSWWP